MEWLTRYMAIGEISVAVAFILHFRDRIRNLEKQFERNSADLVRIVNRMGIAVLRTEAALGENTQAEDLQESLKIIAQIGSFIKSTSVRPKQGPLPE